MNQDNHEAKAANLAETKLLASALRLFSEKGYEGTSIREIIEGAGVTRPVLYYYFQNKEDLFCRLVETKFNELTMEIRKASESVQGCKARLKAIIRTTFMLAENNPEAARLILQVFFAPPQQGPPINQAHLGKKRFRLIEEIMRDGLQHRELAGGDAQSLALAFLGIMDMFVMAKYTRPETPLTPELGDGLVELFFHGAEYREHPPMSLVSPYASAFSS